jgi:hypothetical protein
MSKEEADSITGDKDWEPSGYPVQQESFQQQLPSKAPFYRVDLSAPSNYPLTQRQLLPLSQLRFGDDWERRQIEKIEAEGRTWYKPEELRESVQRIRAIRAARVAERNRDGLEMMRLLEEGRVPYNGDSEEEK